jgi:hypothetical protein
MMSLWPISATILVAQLLYATTPVAAQAMRTYVSTKGSDSAACTSRAPCSTLRGALSKTASGGEIYVLGPGNYGSVTIAQAVSIVSAASVTGTLASSTSNGIIINAGPNDIVDLRGLEVDGAGSGAIGIQFNSGAGLQLRDSVVRGFATGISFQPFASSALTIESTLLSGNGTALSFQGAPLTMGLLNDIQAVNNGSGIIVSGATSDSSAIVTLRNSVVANNTAVGIQSNGNSTVTVVDSSIANNGVGVQAQNTGAILQVTGSTLAGNTTGWLAGTGGQVVSARTNSIGGNATGNSAPPTTVGTTTPPPPPPPPLMSYLQDDNGGYILDSNGKKVIAS